VWLFICMHALCWHDAAQCAQDSKLPSGACSGFKAVAHVLKSGCKEAGLVFRLSGQGYWAHCMPLLARVGCYVLLPVAYTLRWGVNTAPVHAAMRGATRATQGVV
jgi:hypothetical protein